TFYKLRQKKGAASVRSNGIAVIYISYIRYLGASGVIQPGTLLAWQNEMHEQGYALNTICACITTANLYLTHKGKPGLCQPRPHYEERPDSTLTKAEYFQLLQTARAQGLLREEM